MKISYVVAESPGNVALKTAEYDPQTLKPDEVLLKNEYSVISAGTERAWIIGQSNNPGQHFPFYPGYSASGYVAAAGSEVTNLKAGAGDSWGDCTSDCRPFRRGSASGVGL